MGIFQAFVRNWREDVEGIMWMLDDDSDNFWYDFDLSSDAGVEIALRNMVLSEEEDTSIGNHYTVIKVAHHLWRSHRHDEAEHILRVKLREPGTPGLTLMNELCHVLKSAGRADEAQLLMNLGIEPDGSTAQPW